MIFTTIAGGQANLIWADVLQWTGHWRQDDLYENLQ